MHRKLLAWTLILFVLVMFSGIHGGFIPLILVEVAGIVAMLTGESDSLIWGLYAVIHISSLFTLTFLGRQLALTKTRLRIMLFGLVIHVFAPFIMTIDLTSSQRMVTLVTALPFLAATITLIISLARTYRTIHTSH